MMTGYDFTCWLRGVLDMNPDGLDAEQVAKIAAKAKTVKSPQEFAKAQKEHKPTDNVVLRC